MATNWVAYNTRKLSWRPESRSGCPQGHTPSAGSWEDLFSASSSPWSSVACRFIIPVSASVFTWPPSSLLSLTRMCVFGAHPPTGIQNDLPSASLVTLQRPFLQIRRYSQGLDIRMGACVWRKGGATMEPTTGGQKTHITKRLVVGRVMKYHWPVSWEGGGLRPGSGHRAPTHAFLGTLK